MSGSPQQDCHITSLSAELIAQVDELIQQAPPSASYLLDCLLDLRLMLLRRAHAGQCVECFFKVTEGWKHQEPEALRALRNSLAALVEIVGLDAKQRECVKLPTRLDADTLESFCLRIIGEVQKRRAELGPIASLEFRFKAA